MKQLKVTVYVCVFLLCCPTITMEFPYGNINGQGPKNREKNILSPHFIDKFAHSIAKDNSENLELLLHSIVKNNFSQEVLMQCIENKKILDSIAEIFFIIPKYNMDSAGINAERSINKALKTILILDFMKQSIGLRAMERIFKNLVKSGKLFNV